MQIQLNQANQTNPYNQFNSRLVSGAYKTNAGTSLHARRRMMAAQDEAKETESVKVTISGEAMALARQAKAMERLEQFVNANADKTQEANASELGEESNEPVQLTDEELYEELLDQLNIWGDKSYALLHDFNHKETAEMAEKRAAALTEMQKLEEMQESEISKLQREAQKAAEQASMQQEELNKKNSELIMMMESLEDQDEENAKAAEGGDDKADEAKSTGSLMEGEPGAMAVKGEMGILDTMDRMDQSSAYRIASSDHSIKAVEAERINIYRMNDAENFTMKEKIEAMSYYVSALANNEEVRASFMERIEKETDPDARKKLQAKMEYFDHMEMRNGYRDLKDDREFALQERITARDLRIAHLGDRHFTMAEQQEKELQSLFDEDDILRTQGQDSVTSRTEEIAERLQDKLDERDHVDEETTPEKAPAEDEKSEGEEKEQSEEENDWPNSIRELMMSARRYAEIKGLLVSAGQ